ncbi:hypothetical protein OHS33_39645 (plasmid) [Streptomyces sp. NBC_00536]|uniref:hypothetical protein n=1 Tax=Streptomyces sp. NBC_00536 TaxID=2975769 RepID=UPI002E7FE530|nr:hypothetical protein [Streptomyces sp. NBC_00536]WUC84482.1 hypothetical protein OHS33_39645 [Streptomyces sp. NBC_00536]
MRKILHLNAAVALAAAAVLSTAAPAAADSSSCTHHVSGPQVCIRLEGSDVWATPVAIWVNPPKNVKTREVALYVNGERPRFSNNPATATRIGKTLSYSWGRSQWDPESKICVRFKDVDRVACERIKSINRAQF